MTHKFKILAVLAKTSNECQTSLQHEINKVMSQIHIEFLELITNKLTIGLAQRSISGRFASQQQR